MREVDALQILVLCIATHDFCGKFENFIHFPTWSYDAICCLLDPNLAPKEVIHA
jgi:hypothetical protein